MHYYFEDRSVELFNLKHDIGEKNNVAQKNPVMVSKLKEELENWWKNTQAAIPREKNTKFLINDDF